MDELKNQIVKLSKDNIELKRRVKVKEESINELSRKLVRVISERKKLVNHADSLSGEQKGKIQELEEQLGSLKEKLLVARQQLDSYTRLYPYAKPSRPVKPLNRTGSRVQSHNSGKSEPTKDVWEIPEMIQNLLIETKAENLALENQLKILQGHLSKAEREIETSRELLRISKVEHEEEMLSIKLQKDGECDQKEKKLSDNIQLIRLQRDSRRTSNWLATLEAQCRSLEQSLKTANESIEQLETQLSEAQTSFQTEQNKNIELLKKSEINTSDMVLSKEKETQIKSLQDENRILRESNESLMAKAFNSTERIKKIESEEASVRAQITKLEETLRNELIEKSTLISSLSVERERNATFQCSVVEFEKNIGKLKELVKEHEEKVEAKEKKITDLLKLNKEFEDKVSSAEKKAESQCEACKTQRENLEKVESQLAKTNEDLNSTKNLLSAETLKSKEREKEVKELMEKLEQAEAVHHVKLQELLATMEQRAEQMVILQKGLEQMKEEKANKFKTEKSTSTEKLPNPVKSIDPSRSNSTQYTEEQVVKPKEVKETSEKETITVPLPENEDIPIYKTPPPPPPPSLEIFIDKFIPSETKLGLLKETRGLFATWELDNFGTKYTPIVRDGIFSSSSSLILGDAQTNQDKIEVQIHEAVGSSDCRTLAKGFLEPVVVPDITSIMRVCPMRADSGEYLGDLYYSCVLRKVISEKRIMSMSSQPPFKLPSAPVPKRRTIPDPSSHGESSVTVKPKAIEAQTKSYKFEESQQSKFMRSPRITQSSPEESAVKSSKKRSKVVDEGDKRSSSSNTETPKKKRSQSNKEEKRKIGSKDEPSEVIELLPPSKVTPKQSVRAYLTKSEESPSTSHLHKERSKKKVTVVESKQSRSNSPIVSEEQVKNEKSKQPIIQEVKSLESVSIDSTSTRMRKRSSRRKERDSEESEMSQTTMSEIKESSEDEKTKRKSIKIEITYVVLSKKCSIYNNSRIENFFVEYRFLNYNQEETETPNSIQKPSVGKKAKINFTKVFLIDTAEKKRLLKEMINEDKKLRFTLVTEPPEDDTLECEDIGYAYFSLRNMISENCEIVDKEIPIYDSEVAKAAVGSLCISIKGLKVLKSLYTL